MDQHNLLLVQTKDNHEVTRLAPSIGTVQSRNKDEESSSRTKDGAVSNLRVHASPLTMKMLWTPQQRCAKPPMTRKKKGIVGPVNASSVANRDTSHVFALRRKTGRPPIVASST